MTMTTNETITGAASAALMVGPDQGTDLRRGESLTEYRARTRGFVVAAELDDYRPARVAVDRFALPHDAVKVNAYGRRSWLVEAINREACPTCAGSYIDPERGGPCHRCDLGRVGPERITESVVVTTRGKVSAR